MKNEFKLWSEISKKAKINLKPDLGLRDFGSLDKQERQKVLQHLMHYGWFKDKNIVVDSIISLNRMYKSRTYGERMFQHGGPHRDVRYHISSEYEKCCTDKALDDLSRVVTDEGTDTVLEDLSIYAQKQINSYYLRDDNLDEEKAYDDFDKFANAINDVFGHFGISVKLSRQGFVPIQEEIIEDRLAEPVMKRLSNNKWEPVSKEVSDALTEYNKQNEKAYSNAITHIVSALQAYLQILIEGKVGKKQISALIRKGIKEKKLPNDKFSIEVISAIESTLMQARQKHGDAHPKKEYANEQTVRLALNLTLLFIQHTSED